jgi:hypothetical protein
VVGWFRKTRPLEHLQVDQDPDDSPPESSGLSPEDRASLMTEGASTDELGWIDAWLRNSPGRTLEDLRQEEDRLIAGLRRYVHLFDDIGKSKLFGLEQDKRLREERKMTTAALSKVDRDVLVRGLREISASERMTLAHKNIQIGLIRTALASGNPER